MPANVASLPVPGLDVVARAAQDLVSRREAIRYEPAPIGATATRGPAMRPTATVHMVQIQSIESVITTLYANAAVRLEYLMAKLTVCLSRLRSLALTVLGLSVPISRSLFGSSAHGRTVANPRFLTQDRR